MSPRKTTVIAFDTEDSSSYYLNAMGCGSNLDIKSVLFLVAVPWMKWKRPSVLSSAYSCHFLFFVCLFFRQTSSGLTHARQALCWPRGQVSRINRGCSPPAWVWRRKRHGVSGSTAGSGCAGDINALGTQRSVCGRRQGRGASQEPPIFPTNGFHFLVIQRYQGVI